MRPPQADRPDVVEQRDTFISAMASLDPARLVFLDESGFKASLARFYGWAPVGDKPIIITPRYGKNITLIGAIALNGVRALRVLERTMDGDEFIAYLRDDLGPTLHKGDIVVMDGPRVHRVSGVVEALAAWGATPLYLPPYSPELNPIEMCWGLMKSWVRMRSVREVPRLLSSIDEAWQRVSRELCERWIRHCGYAVCST